MKQIRIPAFCVLLMLLLVSNSFSQTTLNDKFGKIIFGCYAKNIKDFEDFVKQAKKSGATHINLTNEDLPIAKWEYDVENDPYPSWVATNMGLLKIATPEVLKPYLPQDYAESVLSILEERCKVLRKYGMKASFSTFEPQMLPEIVYTDHPLWRGPRVDQPNRSRVARWAPDIDNPEVLQLYKESLSILLKRCPEIEILSLTTNDSGTGLSWSGGLYSGSSGNSSYKYRRMDKRIFSFFSILQEVAKNRDSKLEIDMQNTRETFAERIASSLTEGMSIENYEGPDGSPYKAIVGSLLDYEHPFYPVMGIPDPVGFLEELESTFSGKAKRLFVLMGDRFNKSLYFEIYDRFNVSPTHDILSRLNLLKDMAIEMVHEHDADQLVNSWLSLHEAKKLARLVNCGGYIFSNGGVQQRWLTRPFIPFPEELKPQDRDYYRKFQFQAKTEEIANDMTDLQGERVYSGWSGRFFVSKILGDINNLVYNARSTMNQLSKSGLNPELSKEIQLLSMRLHALNLICNNAYNAVSYQAQIDKVKASGCAPDPRPVGEETSSWNRTLILETAREEIDNTANLIQLLESTDEIIIDLASSKELEDIRRLGPNFKTQLKQKLRIMNEHWLDYNRLFTAPNP